MFDKKKYTVYYVWVLHVFASETQEKKTQQNATFCALFMLNSMNSAAYTVHVNNVCCTVMLIN